ncbi:ring-cleaving dioxygenase [Roseicitreum antarcticum]|uniref:Glyoxalase family protein n=1 Tax=Roseicitreum antarcticum TaxID=564137 RepID=A0A1H2U322_9RHOB|nr:ring-cleaving dioxygenase [Roseicitreum antarcticum]SDW50318.1 glyoxalase family protein [Roseicitreum antarcticum]
MSHATSLLPIAGLHHVTAISGAPQRNVDFYTGAIGQRLVKKTVNFDDPGTYHLYYGDYDANPGSILTFFPYVGAKPGRTGAGMARSFAYSIRPQDFDALADRLEGVSTRADRFGDKVLQVTDPDGQMLEFITDTHAAEAPGAFHSAALWSAAPEKTARILTEAFGYAEVGSERGEGGEWLRLALPDSGTGKIIDLWRADTALRAQPGAGTIHHIAFRASDNDNQDELREKLLSMGQQVTPRIDRQYFNAIYFREPGGVLFEVATDQPGFTIDEPLETLGTALKLPPQYEAQRAQIEAHLPPVKVSA